MKILEDIAKKKLAALEAGNLNLYFYYDGQYMERFRSLVGEFAKEAQKKDETEKALAEAYQKGYVIEEAPKSTIFSRYGICAIRCAKNSNCRRRSSAQGSAFRRMRCAASKPDITDGDRRKSASENCITNSLGNKGG